MAHLLLATHTNSNYPGFWTVGLVKYLRKTRYTPHSSLETTEQTPDKRQETDWTNTISKLKL